MSYMIPILSVAVIGSIAGWRINRRWQRARSGRFARHLAAATSSVSTQALQTVEAASEQQGRGVAETAAGPTLADDAPVQASTAEVSTEATAPATVSGEPVPLSASDPLEHIRGIGPVYAQRLQEAGIRTFADLAAQTPARLRQIVTRGEGLELSINPQNWITQARNAARGETPDV